MGPGDNAYKLRWAEEFELVQRVMIYASTMRGRWQALRDLRLRPAARWVRDKALAFKCSNKE